MKGPGIADPVRRYGWIYLVVALVAVTLLMLGDLSSPKEISWADFESTVLARKAVQKIIIMDNRDAQVWLKPEFAKDSAFRDVFHLSPFFGKRLNPGPHYHFTIGSVETFERKLEQAKAGDIEVQYASSRNVLLELLPWLIPLVLVVILVRMFSAVSSGPPTSSGPSVFSFGRSTARLQEQGGTSKITFADVAGLEEAKFEVREICDFLRDPGRYTRLGARIPKGVMIVGPPGTGKTLLAKAVAGEAKVPFFSLSGSEFVEMFVGVGASRVRDLFRRAKEKAPCIVFIDEIDAVGRSRGRNSIYTGANDERESTLNQLLTEMDGFESNSGVIVLAATNRADVLDPALLRPGRFDRHIYLELPGLTERKEIFQVHLRPMKPSVEVDVDFLAAQTPGFSGADIANICNEAGLIAARSSRMEIMKQDFMDAIDRVVAGLERKTKIITPREKKIIAFHEAGHAVASWYLPTMDPLLKVSIIPRGKTLGASWYLPAERQLRTVTEFSERLSALLSGRAAEEIIFGEVSSGALDDLEKVTKEAYLMVVCYGFNKRIGNVSFNDSTGKQENAIQRPYSEETARVIDEEVRKLVDEAYVRARALLSLHRDELVKLAGRLLQKEIILQPDLEAVMGKRNPSQEAKLPSAA